MRKISNVLFVILLILFAHTGETIVSSKKIDKKPKSTANSSLYRDAIDEPIKADLRKLWSSARMIMKKESMAYRSDGELVDIFVKLGEKRHLVMRAEDLNYVRNRDADRRTIQALVELAKTHTLAVRMKIGYENEQRWISRETSYSSGGEPNISAHFTAQAYDIFYADGVEIAWQVSSDLGKRAKAHKKIRQLIKEILAIGQKDNNLLPTQMMIYSWDDVNVFAADLNKFYGPASERGNSGMWDNARMWDRIHIGY